MGQAKIIQHNALARRAIIGSGPTALAAADQLNKSGRWITDHDRNDCMGGLLIYGIPNMKLDKKVVQHRLDLLAAEESLLIVMPMLPTNSVTWPWDLKIAVLKLMVSTWPLYTSTPTLAHSPSGDTGNDYIRTWIRYECNSAVNDQLRPQPPRHVSTTPHDPVVCVRKVDHSHCEMQNRLARISVTP